MAGNFDVHNFILPENKFEGLYKDAGELNLQNKQKAEDEKNAARQKLLGQKYIQSQFKNHDIFTGTPYDPMHNQLGGDIVNDFSQLIEAGVDVPTAQMALHGKIAEWVGYETNAKDFKIKNDQFNQTVSKRDDINKDELTKTVQNLAFTNPETGKVDVSQYDPNKNYWDEALNKGDNVFNSNGVRKWLSGFKPTTDTNAYKYTGATGQSTYSKNALSYPSFMQPIEDPVKGFQGFEPKHEIATDDNNTILHQFGEQKGQPIKLLSQDVWDAMPTENKMYYVQQVRSHIKQTGSKTPLDSQQSENYARALAYDDAKTFGQSNTKANFSNQTNKFDKYAFADYNERLKQKLFDYQSTGGAGRLNQGNVFDLFGVTSPIPIQGGGQVLNGKVYDKDGNVMKSGKIQILKTDLPAEYTNVMTQGAKQPVSHYTTMDIGDDGTIQAAHTSNGVINREQMNDFQSNLQTKGKVAPKKTFGQNAAPTAGQPKEVDAAVDPTSLSDGSYVIKNGKLKGKSVIVKGGKAISIQ